MNNKVLVLGTIAYDGIETPLGSRDKILGGCATYIGLSASLFNNDCGIVSIIGSDFKTEDLKIIKDKGLDCSGVEIVENSKTFYWRGRYENNLNSRTTIETQLNVLEKFTPFCFASSNIFILDAIKPIMLFLICIIFLFHKNTNTDFTNVIYISHLPCQL